MTAQIQPKIDPTTTDTPPIATKPEEKKDLVQQGISTLTGLIKDNQLKDMTSNFMNDSYRNLLQTGFQINGSSDNQISQIPPMPTKVLPQGYFYKYSDKTGKWRKTKTQTEEQKQKRSEAMKANQPKLTEARKLKKEKQQQEFEEANKKRQQEFEERQKKEEDERQDTKELIKCVKLFVDRMNIQSKKIENESKPEPVESKIKPEPKHEHEPEPQIQQEPEAQQVSSKYSNNPILSRYFK